MEPQAPQIVWFEAIGRNDVASVGGKNASLGEMVQKLAKVGITVPGGFATTTSAYWEFIDANDLRAPVEDAIRGLEAGQITLAEAGATIRGLIVHAQWPDETSRAIVEAYRGLGRRVGVADPSVAVRSSATAEDLPSASFAGQQETYLNVRGERELLAACRKCLASLFTDRAISYRKTQNIDHLKVALSVGIQQMVRSDIGAAGVMFTVDTETGFDQVVVINAAPGLGENVVKGVVDPDEYQVFKPLMADTQLKPVIEKKLGSKSVKMIYAGDGAEATRNVPTSKLERASFTLEEADILALARWACIIERHYGCAMDIEWAKAGDTGKAEISACYFAAS